MSALGLLVRRSLRSNSRGILGLVLVIALTGAVSLTALAGARRTASAFPRYLEASHASDVAINVISVDETAGDPADAREIAERAARLPEVEAAAAYIGLEYMVILDPDNPTEAAAVQPEILGSLDGRFIDQDTVALDEGRLPRASSLEEVFVNRREAQSSDLHVGSVITLAAIGGIDQSFEGEPVILGQIEARVVGIGQFLDEVLGDDFDGSQRVLATPALTAKFSGDVGTYTWQGLRLTPGTTVDEAIAAYRTVLDDAHDINVQRTDVQVDRVQRAVRPVVAGLTVFGIAAGLAALALGALGALRLIAAMRADVATLRALGLSAGGVGAVVSAPALLAVAIGALGAAVGALVLSPLTPVGPVRDIEPHPGVALDATVLLVGTLALALLLSTAVTLFTRRTVRRQQTNDEGHAPPSRIVALAASIGLGPIPAVGIRHAVGGGQHDGVPTRSTLAACTVSVVAMASALTFGASVSHLIEGPAGYGWAADLAISSGGGYDELQLAEADAAAAAPHVTGLTIAGFGPLQVGAERVNAIGIEAIEGPALVTTVGGRLPIGPDEVALGASTARDLDTSIGGTIDAVGGPLEVVGIVALPAIGPVASAHPSLGQGALLTLDGLSAQTDRAYPSLALVRLPDGIDPSTVAAEVTRDIATAISESPPEFAAPYVNLRPAEVVGLAPARRTANLLAGLLGIAALLALGLTLSSSVRRRGPTFAILSSIGFGRRDLRRTVRWQTNVVTVVALLVGLPLGVVAGRTSWSALAHQLRAAANPQVPLALALAAAAVLVIANLVGELPARRAARQGPPRARRG